MHVWQVGLAQKASAYKVHADKLFGGERLLVRSAVLPGVAKSGKLPGQALTPGPVHFNPVSSGRAGVAKLADASDLGSDSARSGGSSPLARIYLLQKDLRLLAVSPFSLVQRHPCDNGVTESLGNRPEMAGQRQGNASRSSAFSPARQSDFDGHDPSGGTVTPPLHGPPYHFRGLRNPRVPTTPLRDLHKVA